MSLASDCDSEIFDPLEFDVAVRVKCGKVTV